jgi:hypothetical protein
MAFVLFDNYTHIIFIRIDTMTKNNRTPLQEALPRKFEPLIMCDDGRIAYEKSRFDILVKAAQAYADLPRKIAMLKSDGIYSKIEYRKNVAHIKNDIIDDILNLLKEGV